MSTRDLDSENVLRAGAGATGPPGAGGTVRGALARMRDPILFGVVPLFWALWVLATQHAAFGPFGFDFEGTVWEPARAIVDGRSPYPPPAYASIEIGNPAVYPPLIPMLALPLGFLADVPATIVWTVLLVAAVVASLRILDVRDWRCYSVALTALPVLEGFYWGNIAPLLLVPVAVAWRYRDVARITGLAVGIAVAAKLFAWPLIVWLVLTRRFRAAVWAAASIAVLVLGPWAVIGFDGLVQYPELLRELQDVYAIRSFSLATIASGFGASVVVGVLFAGAVGVALLAWAAWLSRRLDGDRKAFTVSIAACVAASPIVWPYYLSLFLVPIAIVRPRLAPVWFYGVALAAAIVLPAYSVPEVETCCRPEDVPKLVWVVSHTLPEPWQATGIAGLLSALVAVLVVANRKPSRARPVCATARGLGG